MVDTDTSNDPSADENRLAYAGVALFGNRASGQPPQWHELEAWKNGTLSATRSAEVLSYIANNAEYFQQWRDVLDAEQWLELEDAESVSQRVLSSDSPIDTLQQSSHETSRGALGSAASDNSSGTSSFPPVRGPTRDSGPGDNGDSRSAIDSALTWLRNLFQQPLTIYGGAMAAILLAVLVVPLMRETTTANLQQQVNRSMDTYIESQVGLPAAAPVTRNKRGLNGLFAELSETDVERQNFQIGLRNAALAVGADADNAWQQWMGELADTEVDCTKALEAHHCESVRDDMNALGQWTLLNYAACQQPTNNALAENFWPNQSTVFDQLNAAESISGSALFGTLFSGSQQRSPEALCSLVDQLLETGL